MSATDNDLQVSTTERKVAFADAEYKLADGRVGVLGRIYGIVLVRTSLLRCLCIQSFPLPAGGKGEQLTVTPVPRTSSGPLRRMRQLKLERARCQPHATATKAYN